MNKILMALFCFGVLVAFTASAPAASRSAREKRWWFVPALISWGLTTIFGRRAIPQTEAQKALFCNELKAKLETGIERNNGTEFGIPTENADQDQEGAEDILDQVAGCQIEIPGITDSQGQLLEVKEEKKDEEKNNNLL